MLIFQGVSFPGCIIIMCYWPEIFTPDPSSSSKDRLNLFQKAELWKGYFPRLTLPLATLETIKVDIFGREKWNVTFYIYIVSWFNLNSGKCEKQFVVKILPQKVLKKLEESIQLGAAFEGDWSFPPRKFGGDEPVLTSIFQIGGKIPIWCCEKQRSWGWKIIFHIFWRIVAVMKV